MGDWNGSSKGGNPHPHRRFIRKTLIDKMKRSKSGYPSRAKNAFNPPVRKYKDPVYCHFKLERELKRKFMEKFPGRFAEILGNFIREAVDAEGKMVFEVTLEEHAEGYSPVPYPGCHVFQLHPKTSKIIGAFRSVRHAGELTGINYASIARACQGKLKSAGGFKWTWRLPGPQRKPKGNSIFGEE